MDENNVGEIAQSSLSADGNQDLKSQSLVQKASRKCTYSEMRGSRLLNGKFKRLGHTVVRLKMQLRNARCTISNLQRSQHVQRPSHLPMFASRQRYNVRQRKFALALRHHGAAGYEFLRRSLRHNEFASLRLILFILYYFHCLVTCVPKSVSSILVLALFINA